MENRMDKSWTAHGQRMDRQAAHTLTTTYPHGLPQFRTMPLTHPTHTATVTTEILSFFIYTLDNATRSG